MKLKFPKKTNPKTFSVKIMEHDYCSFVIKGKKVLSGAPGDPFKYRQLNEFVPMIFKLRCPSPIEKGIKWSNNETKVQEGIIYLFTYL